MAGPLRASAASEEPLDVEIDVETPEHVRFRYRTAGPARRSLAYLMDGLIRWVGLLFLLAGAFILGSGEELGNATAGALLVAVFLVEWVYYVLWEWLWNGSTPGKRIFGLRVVKETGHGIQFSDALLRNLLRAADFLPVGYGLGLIAMLTDRRFRRLGDRVAGTMVVFESPERVVAPLTVQPPLRPEELDALPARIHLTADELDAIEALLRRAPVLSHGRLIELSEIAAPGLTARLGLPPGWSPQRLLALVYARATQGAATKLQGAAR